MVNNRAKVSLIASFILFIVTGSFCENLRFAFLPFKNEAHDKENQWFSYIIPHLCYEKMRSVPGIYVWDPVFLFQVDSSVVDMSVDSVLLNHRNRWDWDAIIGGTFRTVRDSVYLNTTIVWSPSEETNLRIDVFSGALLNQYDSLSEFLLFKTMSLVKFKVSSEDSIHLIGNVSIGKEAFKTYITAVGFEMINDFNSAVTALSRAVELDPGFAEARCRLLNLYNRSGNFTAAMDQFRRTVNLKNTAPGITAELANFLIDNTMIKDAANYIKLHKKNLEKTPNGLMAIGKLYVATGEFQRASSIITKAIANGPVNLDIHLILGTVYLRLGDYQRASDIFNQLIKYRPDYLRYYSLLGATYRNAGLLMESSSILNSAHAINEQNITIMIDLAHTYFKLKWYEKAEQLLIKVLDLEPDLYIAYVNIGVIKWFEGKKNEAEQYFKTPLISPLSKQASLNNLGNILFENNETKKAMKLYLKAEKSGSKNEVILHNLAVANLKKGKIKKAYYYYDELLRLAPDRIDILIHAANLAEKLKKGTDAELYYRKALDIFPYQREVINNLVTLLVKQKRYEEAIKPVEEYIEHFPNEKELIFLLAEVYFEMEWYEVAMMKYDLIVKEFPDAPEGYKGVAVCMYKMIKAQKTDNYDQAIYALKIASERAPADYEPDMLMADLYFNYKKYNDLALEAYESALKKAIDIKVKKSIKTKIKLIEQ
jgi:tetratricopeptide (TPR) repeat protein